MSSMFEKLATDLESLLTELSAVKAAHRGAVDAVVPQHQLGASNLVEYTTLISQNLTMIEKGLRDVGASSLLTSEHHVFATVQAAHNVVEALRGKYNPGTLQVIQEKLKDSDNIAEQNADALLGSGSSLKGSRIMVTLPPEAATDPSVAQRYIAAGMDIARIDSMRDNPQVWQGIVHNIREVARAMGRTVLIVMDLACSKVEIGPMTDGPRVGTAKVVRNPDGTLRYPSYMWITPSGISEHDTPDAPQVKGRMPLHVIVEPQWFTQLVMGDEVRLADARGLQRVFVVTQVTAHGILVEGDRNAWVAQGSMLKSNFERTRVDGIPPITRRVEVRQGDLVDLLATTLPVDPTNGGTTGITHVNGEVIEIGCSVPEIVAACCPGDPVFFANGEISAQVHSKPQIPDNGDREEDGHARVRLVITSLEEDFAWLESGQSLDAPLARERLGANTPRFRQALEFAAKYADLVSTPTVASTYDVSSLFQSIAQACQQTSRHLGVLLRINNDGEVGQLPDILLSALRIANVGVLVGMNHVDEGMSQGDDSSDSRFIEALDSSSRIRSLCRAAYIPIVLSISPLQRGLDRYAATDDEERADHHRRSTINSLKQGDDICTTHVGRSSVPWGNTDRFLCSSRLGGARLFDANGHHRLDGVALSDDHSSVEDVAHLAQSLQVADSSVQTLETSVAHTAP